MAVKALSLNGFPLIGATPGGGRAYLTSFDGWQTRVVERDRSKRTGRHGSSSTSGLDSSREMTLKGVIVYADEVAADVERERLQAILDLGAGRLVVTDSAGTRWIDVTLDEAEAEPRAIVYTDYSFVVTADDPFKRVLTPTTTPLAAGSTVTIPSAGTAAADLLVTVTTAGTVTLSAGGQTLRTGPLPVGAVIDTARATVESAAGVDLFSSAPVVPGSQFPSLPKGGGPVTQAGTAALLVTHYDTYA
jgi:hypothetical protein